jgi:hypothetical protein
MSDSTVLSVMVRLAMPELTMPELTMPELTMPELTMPELTVLEIKLKKHEYEFSKTTSQNCAESSFCPYY